VLLEQKAIGINFIDIYHRKGLYPLHYKPFIPGIEASGVIIKRGEGVNEFEPGQRVAYASPPVGAYAEKRIMPADRLVPLPDNISDEQAASMMTKGLTAEYLLHRSFPVKKGHTILIHAAAGGVGQLVCQWANHIGATVIGTVSSYEKAEIAKSKGCHYPVNYTEEDFMARVMEITEGKGVPVVYDSVGMATFERSLDCLSPLGMMVSFGQSSGPVPPLDISLLGSKGSLFLTRPSLMDYMADREILLEASRRLFEMVTEQIIKISPPRKYRLEDAANAHIDIENRATTGAGILIPKTAE
jgi:NADPH2:quinone reductase